MSEDDPTNRGDVSKQEFDVTNNFLDMSPSDFHEFFDKHFKDNPDSNVVIRVSIDNLPGHLQNALKALQRNPRVKVKKPD